MSQATPRPTASEAGTVPLLIPRSCRKVKSNSGDSHNPLTCLLYSAVSPGQLASNAGIVNSNYEHHRLHANGHKCEHKHAAIPAANDTFQAARGLDQIRLPKKTITELY